MSLVFVPTPLGNLRDITLRAIDALRECDLLVAEDTRVARKLLGALGLPGKEIWSYHEHNAMSSTPNILERARTQLVAVTTDAGMPGISDPGVELAAAARAQGIAVEALPGPSAALGAALLSGFDLRRFVFEGFPPRAVRARREALSAALATGMTSVWYESPQRIRATLADLDAIAPDARAFVLREYTKLHEQQILGTPHQVAAALADPVRGEIVLVLAGKAPVEASPPDEAIVDAAIDALLAEGTPVATIAKSLAERGLGARRELYARATARKREGSLTTGHDTT
ncbi:MAG TPA: 16S rRNA (cytidine(1402)-2'-O)-methyltransferase [Verrucomicrobiae bacterium]|nr:16S rRNA (cytidine(1402)-2'-O)-methyltransferase [Verrucomicrobiae bacterium]